MTTTHDWRIRYAVPLGVLSALLGIGALALSKAVGIEPSTTQPNGVLYYMIPLLVVVVLYAVIRPRGAFSSFGRRTGQGIRAGWYLMAVALVLGFLSYLAIPNESYVRPSAGTIAVYLAVALVTAVFEELLCRGLIQRVIMRAFVARGHTSWRAIVVSSLIFALMHLANLTVHPTYVVGTFTQVIYTLCVGIALGTVYYLTGDLLAAIILHAVFNTFGMISDLFLAPTAQAVADMPLFAALLQIVALLPAILIARRLIRRQGERGHTGRVAHE
ncbi:MAG: CPBP family intramembrane metalloprotease [Bowdeniella nasicola]|nr:CPBP family intramembrane metalloprotease [Bowdeniella nasicola]